MSNLWVLLSICLLCTGIVFAVINDLRPWYTSRHRESPSTHTGIRRGLTDNASLVSYAAVFAALLCGLALLVQASVGFRLPP